MFFSNPFINFDEAENSVKIDRADKFGFVQFFVSFLFSGQLSVSSKFENCKPVNYMQFTF